MCTVHLITFLVTPHPLRKCHPATRSNCSSPAISFSACAFPFWLSPCLTLDLFAQSGCHLWGSPPSSFHLWPLHYPLALLVEWIPFAPVFRGKNQCLAPEHPVLCSFRLIQSLIEAPGYAVSPE